jgi:hypothetical protein
VLTGGFHSALWVCGAIALLAIPVTFLLIRNDEVAAAVAATIAREPRPEPPHDRNNNHDPNNEPGGDNEPDERQLHREARTRTGDLMAISGEN